MNFVIKGDFAYSTAPNKIETKVNAYLLIKDGKVVNFYNENPDESLPFHDYTGKLIIPGLVDLHIHAPQYTFRGLSMDLELIDWLNTHTFPEESKYANLDYANRAYDIFVSDMKSSATTRAVIFSTLHVDATLALMEKLEASGLKTYVGKVNMDRNAPESLCEVDAKTSLEDTVKWLDKSSHFENTKPILTPRFIPTCSDELMEGLGKLAKEKNIKLQSHLDENLGEIEWVKELCPWSSNYSDAYDHFDTFGTHTNTIMAHCVWNNDEEIELMKNRKIFIAHCPSSNANLSSGIAPINRYLAEGLDIGFGSDVAGGTDRSIFKCISLAIQVSKLYWRLVDHSRPAITMPESFYLATLGGGKFFGNVGTLRNGYEADLLVLDESNIPTTLENLSIYARLERFIYLCDDRDVLHKYVAGNQIY